MGAGALFAAGTALAVGNQLMGAYADKKAAKIEQQQYALQSEQYQIQKDILTEQFRQERQKLQGDAVAMAAANGVKVSGSVAESISNSLTQLGLEESRQKFDIDMRRNNLAYEAAQAKANARSQFYASLINAGSTSLLGASTYQEKWGTRVRNVQGQGVSGGNVTFTNASYRG